MTSKCRAIALANVIAKRRARAQARRELADLAVEIEARFEALDDEVRAQRSLRSEVARMHAIEAAVDAKRDEGAWLN